MSNEKLHLSDDDCLKVANTGCGLIEAAQKETPQQQLILGCAYMSAAYRLMSDAGQSIQDMVRALALHQQIMSQATQEESADEQ